MAIAPSELTFNFEKTYQCGNEEANVGNIVIGPRGYEVVAEGVFTYRVNDEGKIVALRAYWESTAPPPARARSRPKFPPFEGVLISYLLCEQVFQC